MKARVITSRDRIRVVAAEFEQWTKRHRPNGHRDHPEAMAQLVALKALDVDAATVADVSAVWSMLRGWVTMRCDGCETFGQEWVVQVGEAQACESLTASLCRGCLADAVEVAK
jgi:hypothetical protein